MSPEPRTKGRTSTSARGTRVLLRPPEASDRREWVALRSSSRARLMPFDPRPPKGIDPYGSTGFGALLENAASAASDISLICRRADGRLLGSVNLNQIFLGPFRSAYLGYWIGTEHLRQGYMTEAFQLALRRSFRHLRLHRLEANIQPHNEPSLALVRRAGFTREGFSRRYLKIAGRWRDHERWALLAEDWKPLELRVSALS